MQQHRTVFIYMYFAIFDNVAHGLKRVSRRLTSLQTMYNVLKYRKSWWNKDEISIYRNRNETAPEPQISSI